MAAPESARKVYWALQIAVLVVVALVILSLGITSDDAHPIGYMIAGLCLVTALVLALLWKRRRL